MGMAILGKGSLAAWRLVGLAHGSYFKAPAVLMQTTVTDRAFQSLKEKKRRGKGWC